MIRLVTILAVALFVPGSPVSHRRAHRASGSLASLSPSAAGPVDFVARAIAEPLGTALGTRVIVDNKPGGNGAIAAETVARSTPTARRCGSRASAPSPSTGAVRQASYDVQRDFAPRIARRQQRRAPRRQRQRSGQHGAGVHRQRKEARAADAGRLHGIGSIPHLAGEQLADATKANLLHVPYKGAAPAITDVMGGRWQRSSATFRVSSRR
jgi:tripartite-type tricarboxylate transporter receptor subunit TctC